VFLPEFDEGRVGFSKKGRYIDEVPLNGAFCIVPNKN
jgi:hypothetical protein